MAGSVTFSRGFPSQGRPEKAIGTRQYAEGGARLGIASNRRITNAGRRFMCAFSASDGFWGHEPKALPWAWSLDIPNGSTRWVGRRLPVVAHGGGGGDHRITAAK